jgi:RNA polymerase sigma-70 factor (ECF subfamily)
MTEAEFTEAYERFSDAIFRHCFYRVFERELALDLTQQAFMKTWEYAAEGRQIDNIRAFLYRVANNLIIDNSRKRRTVSLEELAESGFDPSLDPRPEMESAVDAKLVLRVLVELKPESQLVVVMRYIDGLGPKEIADMLGESENVISVRLHRAVQQLRELISRS